VSENSIAEEEAGVVEERGAEDSLSDKPGDSLLEQDGTAAEEGDAGEPVPEEPLSLEAQLEAATAEAAKNLDGWMRTQAEFANARKRLEKQRTEIYRNATVDIVARLLPILDDFARALDDVPDGLKEHSWLEGMRLVQRKMLGILESFKVTPIEAVGQAFDPNFHEAIMKEDSEEYESGVVTKELLQGYQLGDRVIRPSLVYVAE
jgi:molecular chaperone GrpE